MSVQRVTPEVLLSVAFMMFASLTVGAVAQSAGSKASAPPVNFTADQDHQNMMDQLGIKALRPGPAATRLRRTMRTTIESLANPYPNLPDVLTLKNGKKVTTAEMWWKQRRPEIVEDFEREVYGRVPNDSAEGDLDGEGDRQGDCRASRR